MSFVAATAAAAPAAAHRRPLRRVFFGDDPRRSAATGPAGDDEPHELDVAAEAWLGAHGLSNAPPEVRARLARGEELDVTKTGHGTAAPKIEGLGPQVETPSEDSTVAAQRAALTVKHAHGEPNPSEESMVAELLAPQERVDVWLEGRNARGGELMWEQGYVATEWVVEAVKLAYLSPDLKAMIRSLDAAAVAPVVRQLTAQGAQDIRARLTDWGTEAGVDLGL